jgi:ribosomal protein S18 acetylase RimI-like enzyme
LTANRGREISGRWSLRFELDEPDGIVVVSTGSDGEIVGLASAGPTRDEDAPTRWELYVINVLAAQQGTGVADQLIDAVVGRRPTTLWVVGDNARAQAFYRRHGFSVEGGTRFHESTGAPEIRMISRLRRESRLRSSPRQPGNLSS